MKKKGIFTISLIVVLIIGISFFIYKVFNFKDNNQSVVKSTTVSAENNKNTHIFMCADDGNAMPTCTTIASVLSNSLKDEKVSIHIVSFEDNHMSKENIRKIESLKTTIKDFNLDFTYFDKRRLDEFYTDYWNKAIMVKLYPAELFPDLDRIIWLDDDVIVRESLSDIYNMDMNGKYMAGVEVISECKIYRDTPKFPRWITAGIGVYNLKEFRKNNVQQMLIDSAKDCKADTAPDRYGASDEWALTFGIPEDKMILLPYKYSVMCAAFGKDAWPDLKVEDCAILHYASNFCKPWKNSEQINKKFLDEWIKYYKLTEYAKEKGKSANIKKAA